MKPRDVGGRSFHAVAKIFPRQDESARARRAERPDGWLPGVLSDRARYQMGEDILVVAMHNIAFCRPLDERTPILNPEMRRRERALG